MERKAYSAEGAVSVGPYSHAVEAGELVFLSGQTPIDSNTGKLVEGDITAQTEQCRYDTRQCSKGQCFPDRYGEFQRNEFCVFQAVLISIPRQDHYWGSSSSFRSTG
jgi:hypothetical protein